MSAAWFWLLIPTAPLLAIWLLFTIRHKATSNYLWLACLPALLAAWQPPPPMALGIMWPGAEWGIHDLLGQVLLGFTAVLWAIAGLFAAASQQDDPNRLRFWLFWLLSLSGNFLLIIAMDGASFYVGFTVMSLSAYGLVVHLPGPGPRQAGRVYLQLAVVGEMLLYAGLMMRIHETGGMVLSMLDWQSIPISPLTAIVLFLGFGLKAGFWPLHVWLPLAHPAAPAAASAVLSGAMIKAGILGLWRFLPESDPMLQGWAQTLLAIGLISAFFGVLVGLLQTRAKTVLAYSSVSQIGYILVILALALQVPDSRDTWMILLATYIVHHGLAKGALFVGAGLAADTRLKTWHWLMMAIPALALAGMPFTSGAVAKTLLKEGFAQTLFADWVILLTIGSTATALLLLRALWLMYKSNSVISYKTPSHRQLSAWLALCLLPLFLPLFTAPAVTSLYSLWSLLWPLLLALLIGLWPIRQGLSVSGSLKRMPMARHVSLKTKRFLQRPPIPAFVPLLPNWRGFERSYRHANRNNRDIVLISTWLLCCLLLLSWLGMVLVL